MVRGVLVQQEGPHTPWTPSRATDQPCQCWTSSSCPQRRGTARPTRHQPLFDFTRDGERWRDPGTGLDTPWTSQKPTYRHYSSVEPLHIMCCGSSAEKTLGFDPQKGQEGAKRQASKIISSPLHQARAWISRR